MSKKCSNCESINPNSANYCRNCGAIFPKSQVTPFSFNQNNANIPYLLRHPELHLKPISEFQELFFWFIKPDYIEDPKESEIPCYLYIVKDSKVGILYWFHEKHWYGDKNDYHRIIPCEYDRIEKKQDVFVCYKGGDKVYIDFKGVILK